MNVIKNDEKSIEFIVQNEDGNFLFEFDKIDKRLNLLKLKIEVTEKRASDSGISISNNDEILELAKQMLKSLGKGARTYLLKSFSILFFIFIFSSSLYAQMEYDRGFKAGYEKGYCHNNTARYCNAPRPPVSPVERTGESRHSYQDGYNRGFEIGLEDFKSKNEDSRSSNNGSRDIKRNQTSDPKFVEDAIYQPPIELIREVLAEKQRQYELKKIETKITIQNKTKKLIKEYNRYTSFPTTINDGWHNCTLVDENEIYTKVNVKVESNKIVRIFEGNFELTFTDSKKIKNGIGKFTTDNTEPKYDLDAYFMDCIEDSTTSIEPPIRSYTTEELINKKMYSTIVIQRPGNLFGMAINPVLSINENTIAKIKNGNTILIYVFSKDDVSLNLEFTDKVKKWNPDAKGTEYTANIKYGKTYYFKIVPKWQHFILEQVDNIEVKKVNNKYCEF